jgi:hypothetical protein
MVGWFTVMKDVYQVLREKELDVMRLRQEVEALRFAIPLLAEGGDSANVVAASQPPSGHVNMWPLHIETPPQDGLSRMSFPVAGSGRSSEH